MLRRLGEATEQLPLERHLGIARAAAAAEPRVGQSPRSLARPSLPNSRRPGANPRGCASSARRFPAQSGIRQWACLKVARSPSPRPPWGRAAAVAWPRVLGTALALLAFLIPVRGRVIGFVPGNFTGWRAYVELLAGATCDGLLVVTAVVVALTATLVGGRRWGSATVRAFNAFAVVALGAAVANVEVVAKLGRPLSFQWLYYSEFLGSVEAPSSGGLGVSCAPRGSCLLRRGTAGDRVSRRPARRAGVGPRSP